MNKLKKEAGRKQNFFRKNLKESFSYIASSKNFIYFIIGVFLVFAVLAIVFPAPGAIDSAIKEKIKQILSETEGLGLLQLIQFIFINNALVSLAGLFLGIFFCIVPFSTAASNGYILGYVIKAMVAKLGLSDGITSLWRILPHGIFEIPAIVISLGIGIKLGASAFSALNGRPAKELWENARNAARTFIFVVLPLLVIAAIIEGLLIIFLA